MGGNSAFARNHFPFHCPCSSLFSRFSCETLDAFFFFVVKHFELHCSKEGAVKIRFIIIIIIVIIICHPVQQCESFKYFYVIFWRIMELYGTEEHQAVDTHNDCILPKPT